jgi:HPt (histidine-containing phosphotransfer) domain-containing protein
VTVEVDTAGLLRMLGNDVTVLALIVDTFAANASTQVTLVAGALDRDDLDAVVPAAHRLRGAAGALGASSVAALSARIEDGALAGDHAVVRMASADLEGAVVETIELLRGAVAERSS